LCEKMKKEGIRAEVDARNEKIGYKIREAQLEKVPYMLVAGDREIENGAVSLRSRKDGDMGAVDVDEVIEMMVREIRERTL